MKFTILLSLLTSLCLAVPTPQDGATLSPDTVGGPPGPNEGRVAGVRTALASTDSPCSNQTLT